MRKVVFCAGSTRSGRFPYAGTWRDRWMPVQGVDKVQNQQAALQLLSTVPHLRTVRIGMREWGRDGIGYSVGESPEEWRDRAWWD